MSRYDIIEEVQKYNDRHDPATGRFAPKGGGGSGARAVAFDAKAEEGKLNEIGRRRVNGGAKSDDYKVLGDALHRAPVGTVLTMTGNRGAKFQYTKVKDGDTKKTDLWADEDGYECSSHINSMTWGGADTGAFEFKFDTKDTAPTSQEVRDSQLNATSGKLNQMLGLRRK